MKEVILNDDKLRQEEIDLRKRKVRALIVDDEQRVTLCNYHGIYMLPGGSIDGFETETNALVRELREELGIEFEAKDFQPFLRTITMTRDYPKRNNKDTINRVCETDYYLIRSNKKINNSKRDLTASEVMVILE